jgi:RimJ/RimL family protein N-acetyltransferase
MSPTWSLFALKVRHGELEMREATDADLGALFLIVEAGVVEPGQERFMPRLLLGRAPTAQERHDQFFRYHWGRRAETSPRVWGLALAVLVDGEVVGCQSVHTRDFEVLREVHTGSFLARPAQGRGFGHRMRALALDLSFGGLGAQWAASGFVEGNERSQRISARLGYEPDGVELVAAPNGEAVQSHRLRLSRQRWLERRPAWLDQVEWSGVAEARAALGLEEPERTSSSPSQSSSSKIAATSAPA